MNFSPVVDRDGDTLAAARRPRALERHPHHPAALSSPAISSPAISSPAISALRKRLVGARSLLGSDVKPGLGETRLAARRGRPHQQAGCAAGFRGELKAAGVAVVQTSVDVCEDCGDRFAA